MSFLSRPDLLRPAHTHTHRQVKNRRIHFNNCIILFFIILNFIKDNILYKYILSYFKFVNGKVVSVSVSNMTNKVGFECICRTPSGLSSKSSSSSSEPTEYSDWLSEIPACHSEIAHGRAVHQQAGPIHFHNPHDATLH